MRRVWPSLLILAFAGPAQSGLAAPVEVPSGQPIEFFEVIWEAEGDLNIYRFRYIAPDIARKGGKISFGQAEIDIKHLCESSALPALIAQKRLFDKIIISLSDQEVEFGKAAPDATQFFEVYTSDGTACIWEGF